MTDTFDSIKPAPPAHLPSNAEDLLRTPDDRDAQELPSLNGGGDRPSRAASVASTAEDVSTYSAHRARSRPTAPRPRWHWKLARRWEQHVSVKVPVAHRRDHLALERTFLGYLRTSVALSMVVVAQLFRLGSQPLPGGRLGYYRVSIPLAAAFILSAMAVSVLGAVRFWRQQAAMTRGKVHAGGWEVLLIMGISILVSVDGSSWRILR